MRKLKIAGISNLFLGPHFPTYLKEVFLTSQIEVEFISIPYRECAEHIEILQDMDYLFVCLDFGNLYPNIENAFAVEGSIDELIEHTISECTTLYNVIKNNTLAPILWFGFEDYCYKYENILGTVPILDNLIDRINISIYNIVNAHDIYIDFKHMIAKVGITRSYDFRGKYRWDAPYSKELVWNMTNEIYKQYQICFGITKKCIVLDCDNVLWGGILSEDGIEKIVLGDGFGRPYQDFQRFLLALHYHGVILAICSKNDEEDILRVFREHSGMILKEEHIACLKANWGNKPDNIKTISQELNIGLDSMVFIDDNEFEIHSAKTLLPDVITILYNRETVYDALSCFSLKKTVDMVTIKRRNETYRSNVKRGELRKSLSFDDYLKTLETKVEIHIAESTELARIAELTQRTNKYTNGIRYTVEQLKQKLLSSDYKLYSVYVSDIFSDLGLVGAIGIERNNMDLFALSCRAIGRGIDECMFETLRKNSINSYKFVSTHKNYEINSKLNKIMSETTLF